MAAAPNYEAMYQPIADFAAQKYGIPSGLFSRLIASESSWNPNAVGPVMKDGTTAKGIAQFTNATARDYGVDTVDVTSSLMGAAKLLRDRYDRYGGDLSPLIRGSPIWARA
jgi:soluble lytic murein transglycosylase-like protein